MKNKKSSNETTETIIINKIYNGGYLSNADNIGHEIINLYKADNGNNYIYLNPWGKVNSKYKNDKITVLLITKYGDRRYKILAKAEDVTVLDGDKSKLPGVTYGGVELAEIFSQNEINGEKDKSECYATFVTNKVFKPKEPIYITVNEKLEEELKKTPDPTTKFIYTQNHHIGRQRSYYNQNEKKKSFEDLNEIIKEANLWEEENTTDDISKMKKLVENDYFNFMKIIKQEDNELAFSNMFSYFFDRNRKAFSQFSNDVLKIEGVQENFKIERETENIDLLIYDNNNVIVIENKIKSGINGVRHDINGEPVQTQLGKYYRYIKKEFTKKKNVKFNIKFFIFTPDYNIFPEKFKYDKDVEKYDIIHYSEIYEFFNEKRKLFKDEDERYLKEFINAMYKHTKKVDNDLEEEMLIKFSKRFL